MESRIHCAYNQTRECFLGLAVSAADLHYSALAERMKTLVLRSGEGLWLAPFRGLPASEIPAPLDILYLDEEGRVLDAVESFPTFHARLACPVPASVLALPAHSIYSSQTQAGDQLVVCEAGEMEERLERISRSQPAASLVQNAVVLREQPLWSGGPGMLEFESRSARQKTPSKRHEMGLTKPGRSLKVPRAWLERWWAPDPRKAPRQATPGLAAYYWNGAPPVAHGIRDLSSSGVYMVTEERWYPGTLVLMTQPGSEAGEPATEHSIPVQTRAVRWGQDGVGLQFVLADAQASEGASLLDEMDRKEFERFLEQLKKGR
ncbi:MAG: hypothetical protein ACLGPM_08000 [Acidobacteriota bacterium]